MERRFPIFVLLFSTCLLTWSQRTPPSNGRAASLSAAQVKMLTPSDTLRSYIPSPSKDSLNEFHEVLEEDLSDETSISIRPAIIPSDQLYMGTWNNNRVKKDPINFKTVPDQVFIRLVCAKKKQGFVFPCKGRKSSNYGWRWGRSHNGVDFAANIGDSIVAAFDGVVRMVKYNGGYGNMIVIRHWNNLETLYGHLSAFKVKIGQSVKAGDLIGWAGNTGKSTGPHLHFETRFLYEPFDPEWILDIETRGLRNETLILDKYFFGSDRPGRREQLSRCTPLAKVDQPQPYRKESRTDKEEKAPVVPNFTVIYKCSNTLPKRIDPDIPLNARRYYRAKEDDTLPNIAQRYNISLRDLREINNKSSDNVPAGTRIRIH